MAAVAIWCAAPTPKRARCTAWLRLEPGIMEALAFDLLIDPIMTEVHRMLGTPRRSNGGCGADVLIMEGGVIISMLIAAIWCAHSLHCLLTCWLRPVDAVTASACSILVVANVQCRACVNDAVEAATMAMAGAAAALLPPAYCQAPLVCLSCVVCGQVALAPKGTCAGACWRCVAACCAGRQTSHTRKRKHIRCPA
jgi:hypothetical protein